MLWDMLTTTININAKTVTTGSTGNSTDYVSAYTNLPANVQPGTDTLALHEDARKITASWDVFLAQSVTVNPGDQVVWSGTKMYVSYVKNLIGFNQVYVLHCTQFQDGA